MRTNYVLIDFESVQPKALSDLEQDHFKLIVFVGASQAKVPFELAATLQRMGDRADYIKISGNGPNALDFHIAFYIGQLAASEPTAYFHIISKDVGFDPLIHHLKVKKIFAARAKCIEDIPLLRASNSKTPEERLEIVVAKLQQLLASRPRTAKTLASTIAGIFQKQLPEAEVSSIITALGAKGFVSINGTKVVYCLPQDG